MKKNNFKKIFVVFSLCFVLLSLFSVSSFALHISDVSTGFLYKFSGPVTYGSDIPKTSMNVNGYLVDKSSGNMTSFTSLQYGWAYKGEGENRPQYYYLDAITGDSTVRVVGASDPTYDVYIDYSKTSTSKSDVESVFSQYWSYTVEKFDSVQSMFDKAHIALVGGTNSEGVAYDGLLGMISKFGKFLVSSPLLLVLCIALPLVSFSVGLIIRIKNRA